MDSKTLYLILQILPAVVILFWAMAIFFKKGIRKSQLLMVAGMVMAIFSIVDRNMSVLFIYPLFFLAIREVTLRGDIPKWDWLIFLPSLILAALKIPVATNIFLCLQMMTFSIWAVVGVSHYNKAVAEFFDTENDSADRLTQILLYLIATIVVLEVLAFLPYRILKTPPVAVSLSLFVTAMQCLLGWNVYKLDTLPEIPEEMPKPTPAVPEPQPRQEKAGNEPDDGIINRILKEKMFLNPTISLASMAERLNTNRTYLSNSIHGHYGQNFSDFINHRRIEYALELMKEEGDGTNIKDIAVRSGYSHLQSFYRNFAQIMDMTPKMWLASNRKGK